MSTQPETQPEQKVPKKKRTRTSRAGLVMPVARIHRYMRKANLSERISGGASVYMSATMEYLLAELLSASSNVCEEMKAKRITPRHLTLAIRKDDELHEFLKTVIIPWGGVYPYIEPELIPPPKNPPHDDSDESY